MLGMDNCLEAVRLLGVKHTVYAGSFAVNGKQANYGERAVTEDDPVHVEYQYARHKIMNEWQALDYREKFGMCITGIRAAYVTGPDKVRGSVDHVKIIAEPARGHAVTLPFKDAMSCVLHVDDMAARGLVQVAEINLVAAAVSVFRCQVPALGALGEVLRKSEVRLSNPVPLARVARPAGPGRGCGSGARREYR